MTAESRARLSLDRRTVVAEVLAERGDALVVPGLGSTTWDVMAAGDHPLNFYTWGGMGGATMIGLGLALAQPGRRVLVITGDGELLMGLGSLATVGVERPPNLSLVMIDNECYGETGGQKSHTHWGVDVAGMAAAAGFPTTETVYTAEALHALLPAIFSDPGPSLVVIKVRPESGPLVLPERDGPYIKSRFRQALLGTND